MIFPRLTVYGRGHAIPKVGKRSPLIVVILHKEALVRDQNGGYTATFQFYYQIVDMCKIYKFKNVVDVYVL